MFLRAVALDVPCPALREDVLSCRRCAHMAGSRVPRGGARLSRPRLGSRGWFLTGTGKLT